jgi:hypothetical protein
MVLRALINAGYIGQEPLPHSQASQNCADERVLTLYHNQIAVVTMTQKDTYCLIVDSVAIAKHSYKLENYLVPSSALAPQYQVEGLHVLFSGRKKSCYGLTTLPSLRNSFGYKLEIDLIQARDKK